MRGRRPSREEDGGVADAREGRERPVRQAAHFKEPPHLRRGPTEACKQSALTVRAAFQGQEG